MTPAELDAPRIARGERFVLKDGSETGHCCFQFSIIDVTKPNLPVLCKCFNREDADAILSALRQGQQDAARLRGVVDALEPFRKSLALIDEATSCDIELMARRRAECDAYYSAQSALAAIAAEDQAKCAHGFPGCSRADDQMLSKHFGDAYRAEAAEQRDARDAARYRWLRYLSLDMNFIADEWGWAGGSPDQLDSAIDAALAAEKNDSGKGEQT